MQITKVKCPLCGQEISKSNIAKHDRRHREHPETFKKTDFKLTHEGLNCQFCNKLCKNRNSLCNHERQCSLNPNRQVSGFVQYNLEIKSGARQVWNKNLTKELDERVASQGESLSNYYKTHDSVWKGKHLPEEMRKNIGRGVKKFLIEHPEMVPYKRNHSSNESYPEDYFTKLFINNGIHLVKQYPVHSYHLDFCEPNKLIDIEIDGDQHYLDSKIIKHDIIRTKYLEDNGWIVYRIRWSEFKMLPIEEKQKIVQQIKKLLE